MSSFDLSEIFIYSPRLSLLLQLLDSTSGDGEKRGKFKCGLLFEAAQEIAGLCPKRAGLLGQLVLHAWDWALQVPALGAMPVLLLRAQIAKKSSLEKSLCSCCFVGERIVEKCFIFLLSEGKSQHAAFAGVMGDTCTSLLLKDKRCTVGGCTARERRSIPCTTWKQNLL